MSADDEKCLRMLMALTGIPTAAGKEARVIRWVERWVGRRKNLRLDRDQHGNLRITHVHFRQDGQAVPVFLTAHLDHPAFVLSRLVDERTVEMDFRGGVKDECFTGKALQIFDSQDVPHFGRIVEQRKTTPDRQVVVKLRSKAPSLAVGDIGRWRFTGRGALPTVAKGILYAHACDDLAGAAAALGALDNLHRKRGFHHVGVLLTLAEEVGFIGAIGAASSGIIPANARLICLENSRSFADSPIGAGPILRVGDRIGVFSPQLTNRLTRILQEEEKQRPTFRWQRKLMPGGACEATAFAEFGYESTCVCLPLGNYHNMTDASLPPGQEPTGGVGPEFISVADYLGMVNLLCLCIQKMDLVQPGLQETLRDRFTRRKELLDEPGKL